LLLASNGVVLVLFVVLLLALCGRPRGLDDVIARVSMTPRKKALW